MSDRYSGWANYETWCIYRWLGEDEASRRFWEDKAQEALENTTADAQNTRSDLAQFALGVMLMEKIEEDAPHVLPSAYSDLLAAAISRVEFEEIADVWLARCAGYERRPHAVNVVEPRV